MEFRDEAKLHDVTVAQNEVDLLQMLQTVVAGAGKVMVILDPMRFRKDTQIRVIYNIIYILYYIILYYIYSGHVEPDKTGVFSVQLGHGSHFGYFGQPWSK